MSEVTGPLNEDFLKALGRVSADFAVLETQVSFLTWCLINPRDQRLGQIITAELSFRQIIALLSSVFRHRVGDPAQTADLESILTRALEVLERRNTIVHSSWGVGDTSSTRTRIKTTARKGHGIKVAFVEMTVGDIDDVARSAREVAAEVMQFLSRLPNDLVGRVEHTV